MKSYLPQGIWIVYKGDVRSGLCQVLILPNHSILHPFVLTTTTLTLLHLEVGTQPGSALVLAMPYVPDDTGSISRRPS